MFDIKIFNISFIPRRPHGNRIFVFDAKYGYEPHTYVTRDLLVIFRMFSQLSIVARCRIWRTALSGYWTTEPRTALSRIICVKKITR